MVLAGGQPSGESGIRGEAKANSAVTEATSATQIDTHFMHVPNWPAMALKRADLDAARKTDPEPCCPPRHNLERRLNWGNYKAGLARPARTLSWLCHGSCGTPSQKRDNPSAMMEAHYLGDISNDSLGRGGKALIDRVERPASPLAASLPARAGAAMLRGLSLIHICRCRRYAVCRSRGSPYH